MPVQVQLRRGTTAQWSTANPTLAAGELGVDTSLTKFKVGNGSTAWNSLGYATVTFQSVYASGTTYYPNDIVTYNGSAYVCILQSTGNLPTNATYFSVLASKGDTGATGATGATGPAGSAATIAVGTVTTGAAGSSVIVTNSGTSSAAVLDFTIPRGDTGSVSSVAFSGGTTGLTVTGSPITTSGTITLSGTLAVANGGTGQTTVQAAINALAGATTSGQFLRGNGTNVVMSAIQVADVPTLNQNTTGTAANVTGTVAVANGGTGATTESGARTALGVPAAPTGTSAQLLANDGSGGFSNVTVGSGLTLSSGTLSASGGGGGITMGKAIAAAIVFG